MKTEKEIKIFEFEGFSYDIFLKEYKSICSIEEKEYYTDIPFMYTFKEFREANEERLSKEELKKQEAIINAASTPVIEKVKPRNILKNDNKIIWKTTYFINNLIYGRIRKKEGLTQVKLSSALMKEVIGKDYLPIILTLEKLGYIKILKPKYVCKQSYYYEIPKDKKIKTTTTQNETVIKYVKKTKLLLEQYATTINEQLEEKYGKAFKENYLKSLNQFKINNDKGFNEFIREQLSINEDRKHYYGYIKQYFSNETFNIYKIDKSNRIYHILTSIKREVKKFINIKFLIDISNSHPLLFNKLIFHNRNINSISSYNISYFINSHNNFIVESISKYNIHNVGEYLRKILIDNNIEIQEVAKLKDDELAYLYKTSTGKFWCEFLEFYPELGVEVIYEELSDHTNRVEELFTNGVEVFAYELYKFFPMYNKEEIVSRLLSEEAILKQFFEASKKDFWSRIAQLLPEIGKAEVKKKLFAEVFYSKTTYKWWKYFAKHFKSKYPNVMALIDRWKQPENDPILAAYMEENEIEVKDTATALSVSMMKLEAEIFHKILVRLYKKRISAVHIHDAIAIPNTKGNTKLEASNIEEIIMDVFKGYGLCPTASVGKIIN